MCLKIQIIMISTLSVQIHFTEAALIYKVYVLDVVEKEQAKKASKSQKQIRKLTGMMVNKNNG